MRKKLLSTRLAAFVMSAVITITMAGCGTQGEPQRSEHEADTLMIDSDVSAAAQQDTDTSDNSGTGRYVDRTVCEGEYWDRVDKQILSDGRIVLVNSMTSQRFEIGRAS